MALYHPSSFHLLSLIFSFSLYPQISGAPATNTPVPPLQWIEITDAISGSGPPGLSYASIGYDPDSSTLIIFGGESNNFPQQQTYLSVPYSSILPLGPFVILELLTHTGHSAVLTPALSYGPLPTLSSRPM